MQVAVVVVVVVTSRHLVNHGRTNQYPQTTDTIHLSKRGKEHLLVVLCNAVQSGVEWCGLDVCSVGLRVWSVD